MVIRSSGERSANAPLRDLKSFLARFTSLWWTNWWLMIYRCTVHPHTHVDGRIGTWLPRELRKQRSQSQAQSAQALKSSRKADAIHDGDEGVESKDAEIDRVAHDGNPWLFGEMDGESVFKVIKSDSEGTPHAAGGRPRASPPPGWHETSIVSSLQVGFIYEIRNQIKKTNYSTVVPINDEREKKKSGVVSTKHETLL
jgi:hypothetical protein